MQKEIFYDRNALKELQEFNREVQKEFQAYIALLHSEGRLEFPDARKISKELFEIRVIKDGVYRGVYAYIEKDFIVLLHFFQKKAQKTPLRHIEVARQRLKKYE